MLAFSACAPIPASMNTTIPDLRVEEKIPLRASLLVPSDVRGFQFRGRPQSLTGGARVHEFPLGSELERACYNAFAQVFRDIALVRERPAANDVEVLIEPRIEDFDFRYERLRYFGVAVAAASTIRIRVTMTDGSAPVWTRETESAEERNGPWIFALGPDDRFGPAASAALGSAVEDIARAAVNAPELWMLSDRVRERRGPLP
jgi:hypothetical protein